VQFTGLLKIAKTNEKRAFPKNLKERLSHTKGEMPLNLQQ
jgi:hypothetical protein